MVARSTYLVAGVAVLNGHSSLLRVAFQPQCQAHLLAAVVLMVARSIYLVAAAVARYNARRRLPRLLLVAAAEHFGYPNPLITDFTPLRALLSWGKWVVLGLT
jgi:hypothetical protein